MDLGPHRCSLLGQGQSESSPESGPALFSLCPLACNAKAMHTNGKGPSAVRRDGTVIFLE